MAKDLRTFLRRLEERAPDELLRVRRPVSVDLELTGVLRKLQSEQRYPAVIFERIQDKKLRVVSNLLGNTRLLAEALETTPEELTRTYIEREDARMAVKEVSDAPVQEVVITGADVDLHEMPIVVNCGKDSGQFISAGVTTRPRCSAASPRSPTARTSTRSWAACSRSRWRWSGQRPWT